MSVHVVRVLALALLVVVPAVLAGCVEPDEPAPAATEEPLPTASDAATGAGPAAPQSAFRVGEGSSSATVYPYVVPGQEARPPEHVDASGALAPKDCALRPVSFFIGDEPFVDLRDLLRPGDAVDMVATLRFANADAAWADLHLGVVLPGQRLYWEESVADARGEVVQEFRVQFGYAGGRADGVFVFVDCWSAAHAQDFPYTLEVALTFAEGVVPGTTPHLLRVSPNVTELRVTGAPTTPGETVTGHYRLFRPDDTLLGEFALNSDEAFDAVRVDEPGDYVIIVDHTEGGMLALGADAPPEDDALLPLPAGWGMARAWASAAPGAHAAQVLVDVPRVPLFIVPTFVAGESGPSGGKRIVNELTSSRGLVWHRQIAGEAGVRSPIFYWEIGFPGIVDPWDYRYDHHALAEGDHTLSVTCDACHGEVHLWYQTYLRPGDESPPPLVVAGGGASAAAPPRAHPPALPLAGGLGAV